MIFTLSLLAAIWCVLGGVAFVNAMDARSNMGYRRIGLYGLLAGPLVWLVSLILLFVWSAGAGYESLKTYLFKRQWWNRFNRWLDAPAKEDRT